MQWTRVTWPPPLGLLSFNSLWGGTSPVWRVMGSPPRRPADASWAQGLAEHHVNLTDVRLVGLLRPGGRSLPLETSYSMFGERDMFDA